jgi:hypothetical protein
MEEEEPSTRRKFIRLLSPPAGARRTVRWAHARNENGLVGVLIIQRSIRHRFMTQTQSLSLVYFVPARSHASFGCSMEMGSINEGQNSLLCPVSVLARPESSILMKQEWKSKDTKHHISQSSPMFHIRLGFRMSQFAPGTKSRILLLTLDWKKQKPFISGTFLSFSLQHSYGVHGLVVVVSFGKKV